MKTYLIYQKEVAFINDVVTPIIPISPVEPEGATEYFFTSQSVEKVLYGVMTAEEAMLVYNE